jgi:hypothetical protein
MPAHVESSRVGRHAHWDQRRRFTGTASWIVVIDCSDLAGSARFWTGVPDPRRAAGPAGRTGAWYRKARRHRGAVAASARGRAPKNGLHLDLHTADMDAEVRQVFGLGRSPISPSRRRSASPAAGPTRPPPVPPCPVPVPAARRHPGQPEQRTDPERAWQNARAAKLLRMTLWLVTDRHTRGFAALTALPGPSPES